VRISARYLKSRSGERFSIPITPKEAPKYERLAHEEVDHRYVPNGRAKVMSARCQWSAEGKGRRC
jgi:hypothetical protein